MKNGLGDPGDAAEWMAVAPYVPMGRSDASSKWKDRKPASVSIHARPQSSTV